MRLHLIVGMAVLVGAVGARGEPHHFASGTNQVSLIELFTSEGCSSCPPAERWLGTLRAAPGLWRDFVPLAFHVDYWNRLGWLDRFSTQEFTRREYAYAAAWGSESVYTPCLVKNGIEWTADRAAPGSGGPVGVLRVDYDGTELQARFTPSPEGKTIGELEVHAAFLGAGISSKVTAGENRGETLEHQFVVLALARGALGENIGLKPPAAAGVPRHAVAVWVTRRGSLTPLQATGGWLD